VLIVVERRVRIIKLGRMASMHARSIRRRCGRHRQRLHHRRAGKHQCQDQGKRDAWQGHARNCSIAIRVRQTARSQEYFPLNYGYFSRRVIGAVDIVQAHFIKPAPYPSAVDAIHIPNRSSSSCSSRTMYQRVMIATKPAPTARQRHYPATDQHRSAPTTYPGTSDCGLTDRTRPAP